MNYFNKKQKAVIVIGLSLILLSYLFPCWIIPGGPTDVIDDYQYAWLINPPWRYISPGRNTRGYKHYAVIDCKRLVFQICLLTLFTIGGVAVTSTRKKSPAGNLDFGSKEADRAQGRAKKY